MKNELLETASRCLSWYCIESWWKEVSRAQSDNILTYVDVLIY
jgi:hypothetical protein